ncbi:reverse transcriptase domain-containing protein [Tanacetum coccineum]
MTPNKRTTRASPTTTTTTTTPVTNAQFKALIDQGVADALAARDADRSMNGDDNHNSGTGVKRQAHLARECTYPDFMKCKPLYFKGTEGVVELTRWFERMETVFRISNCTVENQIKFTTCNLLGSTLTWWNAYVRTVGNDVAYAMTWTNLKKMMTDKYCPRGKIKKLEVEMWNLKVKGTDVVSYNQRFQELALMCARMFPEESDKIERYVGGLPDMIHRSVMASKPKTMQDAIEFATELMDQKICTLAEQKIENKRKFQDISRKNQNQQQPFKRHNVAQAYTARPREKKPGLAIRPETVEASHFKNNSSKLRNKNQDGNGNAVARAYGVGTAGTNPNSNVVTGFPAQSVDLLTPMYLGITMLASSHYGTSQSRLTQLTQSLIHVESCKSLPRAALIVGSSRIPSSM